MGNTCSAFCGMTMDLVDQIEGLAPGPNQLYGQQVQQILPYIRPTVQRLAAGGNGAASEISKRIANADHRLDEHQTNGIPAAITNVEDWHGSAADSFKTYLGDANDALNKVMYKAFNDLAVLYGSYAGIVEACHNDVVSLLTNAIGALRRSQYNSTIAFTVASVAVGFLPMLGGLELAVLAVQGTIAITSAVLSSDNPANTYNDLYDGLCALDEATGVKAQQVQDTLDDLESWISGVHLQDVQPVPPAFITGPSFDPNSFMPKDGFPPFQHPVDTRPLESSSTDSPIAQRLGGSDPSAATK